MTETIEILELRDGEFEPALEDLGEILKACVEAGASVGFIEPFSKANSLHFWAEQVFGEVKAGRRFLLAAKVHGHIVGTVQLIVGMLPNQAHRGEISKLLVHPDYRRRGLGGLLMRAAEEKALLQGKQLLTLDTRTGDMAEPLYVSLGFEKAGVIPGYCRSPEQGSQVLDATTYMYKSL
ncbi:MAG: GNAT family N-acetyltransferase [Sneathiella sp.]